MFSRTLRQRLVAVSRCSSRASGTTSAANGLPALRRGFASGTSHTEAAKSSDMPWMIGSGLVTLIGSAYLLTSPSKKHDHHGAASKHASDKAVTSEGEKTTEQPEPETPAPVETSQAAPEGIKDDEGTVVPNEEVAASINQAVDANEPKSAKAAEEVATTEASQAVDKSESEKETADSSEKLAEPSSESVGEAREVAVPADAPKETGDKPSSE